MAEILDDLIHGVTGTYDLGNGMYLRTSIKPAGSSSTYSSSAHGAACDRYCDAVQAYLKISEEYNNYKEQLDKIRADKNAVIAEINAEYDAIARESNEKIGSFCARIDYYNKMIALNAEEFNRTSGMHPIKRKKLIRADEFYRLQINEFNRQISTVRVALEQSEAARKEKLEMASEERLARIVDELEPKLRAADAERISAEREWKSSRRR